MIIPQLPHEHYIMPQSLQRVLTSDPEGNTYAAFDSATQWARAGFRVLPLRPGGKAPLSMPEFPHGARSATSEYERVRDAWIAEPDANVGLAPDGPWVMIDVDPRNGGSLEAVESLGLPVDGNRERTGGGGWHIPLMMPPDIRAIHSPTIAPGIEIKAKGTFAVSSHSRLTDGGRYAVEPDRDVWVWLVIPANWPSLDRLTHRAEFAREIGTITASHRRDARRVVRGFVSAPAAIARDAAALMAGVVPADASSSEADYRLALLASFHTREPEVIAAVLESSKLRRSKWRDHPSYLAVTIAKALERRRFLSAKSGPIDAGTEIRATADGIPSQNEWAIRAPNPLTVSYGTSCLKEGEKGDRFRRILEVVSSSSDHDIGGFSRVPVSVLADSLNVTRRTISRDLAELESVGMIETETRQPAGLRRERWARLVALERRAA